MDTLGIVCEADHPVFGPVGERLAARGFGVEFLVPGDPLDTDAIDSLDALANTDLSRPSFAALRQAERVGLETWNGFTPVTALSCRVVALNALERLGCAVPALGSTRSERHTVRRSRFRCEQPTECREDVFVEAVRSEPVTYRYYAVDDGIETHVQAMSIRSKPDGYRPTVEEADVDVELATRVRELLDRFGARTLAVDFVVNRDVFYAVDVDPAPDFYDAGMERHVADSMASLMTIGA